MLPQPRLSPGCGGVWAGVRAQRVEDHDRYRPDVGRLSVNGRLLWLDDVRDPNVYYTPLPELPQFVLWVETAPAAVLALQTTDWDEVSLDHDLGDDPAAGDGYDVLLWIESEVR